MKKKSYMALTLLSLLVLGGCSSTSKNTESSTSESSTSTSTSVSSEASKTSESSTKDKASDGYTYDEATKTFTNKSGSVQILKVARVTDFLGDPAVEIDVNMENKTDTTSPISYFDRKLLFFEQKDDRGPNRMFLTLLPGEEQEDSAQGYQDPLDSIQITPGEKVSTHYVFYTESSNPIIVHFVDNSDGIAKSVEFPIE
ncbi:hypothetical protein OZX60_03185 [Streptococcaceae bacterium ESL0687]|nr:hypothetical protein OZX60_03185 [Streptococcaceae bacterium ESL0687]